MTREPPPENEDWLSLLDLSAIADPHDKVSAVDDRVSGFRIARSFVMTLSPYGVSVQ